MLAEVLPPLRRGGGLRPGEFWALRDLDFHIRKGEAVALIGHNGAGKSTLLKILYGLIKPDVGHATVTGKTEGIIDLGAANYLMLTGRENVELAASLHGLSGDASRTYVEEVVAFAEIGEFIETPMQSYSSGMKARLSFAASALLKPDLLLLDEVLSVGDLAFQRKCLSFMTRYLGEGGSLLFVSHNPFQIQTVCSRGILLEEGRLAFDGPIVEAIDLLLRSRRFKTPAASSTQSEDSEAVIIEGVTVEATDGGPIVAGQPLSLRLDYRAAEPIDVHWGFSIWTGDQLMLIAGEHCDSPLRLDAGRGTLSCTIEKPPLVGGTYAIRAAVLEPATKQPIALFGFHHAPAELIVEEPLNYASTIKMSHRQLIHLDVRW